MSSNIHSKCDDHRSERSAVRSEKITLLPFFRDASIEIECVYTLVVDEKFCELPEPHPFDGEEHLPVFSDADAISHDEVSLWKVAVDLSVDDQHGGRLCRIGHSRGFAWDGCDSCLSVLDEEDPLWLNAEVYFLISGDLYGPKFLSIFDIEAYRAICFCEHSGIHREADVRMCVPDRVKIQIWFSVSAFPAHLDPGGMKELGHGHEGRGELQQ